MRELKFRTLRDRMREEFKDPQFRKEFENQRRALALAMTIAKIREKKGLTQTQLARRMGTSQQAISRIESGDYEGFTLKTLEKIAQATGTRLKIDFISAA